MKRYTVQFANRGSRHLITVDNGYVTRFDGENVAMYQQAFNLSDFHYAEPTRDEFVMYYNGRELSFSNVYDAWDYFITNYLDPDDLEFETPSDAEAFWNI